VQPEKALRATAGLRQLLDRQRRCGRREDRSRVQQRVQLGQQAGLDSWSSMTRLDYECGCSQLLWIGDDLHVLGVDLGVQPRERLLDGRARALGRALRARQQQHRAVVAAVAARPQAIAPLPATASCLLGRSCLASICSFKARRPPERS